ncbi:MAG: hypothetical protein HYV95_10525 [Opitutae bacterium]|nr:hypothetical protein [Opitutae bacterium]
MKIIRFSSLCLLALWLFTGAALHAQNVTQAEIVSGAQTKTLTINHQPPGPADTNHNGLPDAWEQQYFGRLGVDPLADADGDGRSNAQEYAAGSNPVDFYQGRALVLNAIPRAATYAYDASGRVIRADYGGDGVQQFTHDSASNLTAVATSGVGTTPIAQWRAANSLPADGTGDGADSAILANDGLPNLAKYALGLDPHAAIVGEYPSVKLMNVGGSDYLTLTYVRPDPVATDLTYTVQVSGNNGATWSSGAGATVEVSATTVGGVATIVVRDSTPVGSPNFGRRIALFIERK